MASVGDRIVAKIIEREGGYSNHASDSGGKTMYGITEAVARANGYTGPMHLMPRSLAVTIYRNRYWTGPGFDKVAAVSEKLAGELADTGVNMGPTKAAMDFQRLLTALNRRGKDYPDLFVDGRIGPVTIAALRSYLAKRGAEGERILFVALNCLQGADYLRIAEAREKDEDFLYGQLRSRVVDQVA